ncbi:SPOR domain-containing protein [Lewinella sp. LCG006]|uniref:SPOR domain-containing protein n=1 Tax=Lewinella sp. LCG006 TaxID=3231911 RepID=UPI00345F6E83
MQWIIPVQILVAIIIGGTVARSLSGVIRALVVRSIPVEKRLSEESFNIQTRTSTIIGAAVALLVAGGIYWGIESVKSYFPKEPLMVEEQTVILPFTPPTKEKDVESEEVPISAPITSSPAQATIPDASPATRPTAYEASVPIQTGKGTYYLQLGAYVDGTKALRHAQRLRERYGSLLQTVQLPETTGPNKVLLGPFLTRRDVVRYRQQHQLKGFVRHLP